jgi:hypothetical protein
MHLRYEDPRSSPSWIRLRAVWSTFPVQYAGDDIDRSRDFSINPRVNGGSPVRVDVCASPNGVSHLGHSTVTSDASKYLDGSAVASLVEMISHFNWGKVCLYFSRKRVSF